MKGTWWVGGEINAGVPRLTELQVKINCDLMRKQGKTVRSWLAGNLRTYASLFLIGRNKNRRYKCVITVQRAGKRLPEKYPGEGSQGSIELNINSSLCFGKNSQLCQARRQQLTFFNQAWEIGLQAWASVRSKFSTCRPKAWELAGIVK